MLLSLDVEEPRAGQDLVSESPKPWRRAFGFGLAAGVFAFAGLATVIKVVLQVHTNHSMSNENPHPIDETLAGFVPPLGKHPRHDLRASPLIKPGRLHDDVSMLMWISRIRKRQEVNDASSKQQATTDDGNTGVAIQTNDDNEGSKPKAATRQRLRNVFVTIRSLFRRNRKLIEEVAQRDDPGMRAAQKVTMVADFCQGLPGALPNGDVVDPLGFLTDAPEERVLMSREAELFHGRLSMLASLGFLTPDGFHPLFPGWDQFHDLPGALQFGIIMAFGVCEARRGVKTLANPFEGYTPFTLKEDYVRGNLDFDPLGIKPTDPEKLREMKEGELWNGRIAMLAAAAFLVQEAFSHTAWKQHDMDFGQQLADLLSRSAGSS